MLKPVVFDEVKTICVGNLCAGGSGKTPHTEYILKLLENENRLAALSRGYKRKTSGFYEVLGTSTPEQSGDESLQVKRKFTNVLVAVSESRVKGVKKILEQKPETEVIILDDAFQHRRIKCGLTILLTEYDSPYYKDSLLPAGRLRENPKGALRADIIIVTKTPEYATAIDLRTVMKEINPRPYQNLFYSYLKYGDLYGLWDRNRTMEVPKELFIYKALLVTGIANPRPMLTYLKEYAEHVTHKKYADHYQFADEDIIELVRLYTEMDADNKIIVTTEKDSVRLNNFPELLKDLPIFVLPVEIDFKNKTEEFSERIQSYVRTNKIYHKKYS